MIRRIFLALLIVVGGISYAHAQRKSISADIANIRSGPGSEFAVIWQVEKYHPIDIIGKKNKWYHFRDFEGQEGWVHSSLVGNTPAVITIKDECNIRSGPGTKYDVTITVGIGIPFKVIEKNGGWLYLEHADGDRGWIYKSLVW